MQIIHCRYCLIYVFICEKKAKVIFFSKGVGTPKNMNERDGDCEPTQKNEIPSTKQFVYYLHNHSTHEQKGKGIDIVGVGVVECLVGDGRGWNDRGRRVNQDIF